MGTDNVDQKRKLEMSKILTYNHIVFEDQRHENERSFELLASCSTEQDHEHMKELQSYLDDAQKKIKVIAEKMLGDSPIWHFFLCHVTDVPPIYSFALIVNIADISRFNSASKLWAYCGMHNYKVDVASGKRWFRTRQSAVDFVTSVIRINGEFKDVEATPAFHKEIEERLELCVWGSGYNCEKIAAKSSPKKLVNWNMFFRSLCWRVGESIRKGHGFYHGRYLEMVAEKVCQLHNVNETDVRIVELQSARHITKLFLIHTVQYWRQMEGLTTKAPLDGREKCIEFPGLPIDYSEK